MSDNPKYQGREQSIQANTARVSSLVGAVADDMERTRTGEKIPLADVERIKRISTDYMRECSENGTLPSVRGVAARLGVTRQALYDYSKHHQNSEFAQWLEDFSDACGTVMMSAALEGAVAPVPAIFVAKSRYQWRESPQQLEIGQINPLGDRNPDEIAAEIAAKYHELPEE